MQNKSVKNYELDSGIEEEDDVADEVSNGKAHNLQ